MKTSWKQKKVLQSAESLTWVASRWIQFVKVLTSDYEPFLKLVTNPSTNDSTFEIKSSIVTPKYRHYRGASKVSSKQIGSKEERKALTESGR